MSLPRVNTTRYGNCGYAKPIYIVIQMSIWLIKAAEGHYPKLNQRGIWFITIRRRGAATLRRLQSLPASQWHHAVIDTAHRRHQRIRYVDETVKLPAYDGELRQVAVAGLGREQPTLFLSNNVKESARSLIVRYAGRNRVEDTLGSSVNFFHLDCLASEVRLNVDLDAMLTVLANGCYRWLAKQLHGFETAAPKQLFRKFVETLHVRIVVASQSE